jgi:hypothetical protein
MWLWAKNTSRIVKKATTKTRALLRRLRVIDESLGVLDFLRRFVYGFFLVVN